MSAAKRYEVFDVTIDAVVASDLTEAQAKKFAKLGASSHKRTVRPVATETEEEPEAEAEADQEG